MFFNHDVCDVEVIQKQNQVVEVIGVPDAQIHEGNYLLKEIWLCHVLNRESVGVDSVDYGLFELSIR